MNAPQAYISHISWEHMEVTLAGKTHAFKDCKVWPQGATAWDWTCTGTRHRPGTQPADIAELLTQGVEVMILTRGMQLMLHTSPETEALLQERGIAYAIEETIRAVQLYNDLARQGKKVGGVFHSTC